MKAYIEEPQHDGDFYYLLRAEREPKQRKIIEYFPNNTPITFIQGYCFAKNITLVPNPNTQAK